MRTRQKVASDLIVIERCLFRGHLFPSFLNFLLHIHSPEAKLVPSLLSFQFLLLVVRDDFAYPDFHCELAPHFDFVPLAGITCKVIEIGKVDLLLLCHSTFHLSKPLYFLVQVFTSIALVPSAALEYAALISLWASSVTTIEKALFTDVNRDRFIPLPQGTCLSLDMVKLRMVTRPKTLLQDIPKCLGSEAVHKSVCKVLGNGIHNPRLYHRVDTLPLSVFCSVFRRLNGSINKPNLLFRFQSCLDSYTPREVIPPIQCGRYQGHSRVI
ncbi:uncharacterized protein G2W53_036876 [Senna tora]|uniref:Uncharacterized protein n=1 Tax=Senna tora TaxID=362788 RepID=A0A834SVA1_9FABA|nr:uncharacterized protein G2W53_036876 [Senna tora]